MGYMFFFQTYLVGPFIEFNDYKTFIESKEKPAPRDKIIKRLGQAFFLLTLMLTLKTYFPYEHILDNEFWSYSFTYRLLYCYLASLGFRLAYEFIWTFVHANLMLSGFAPDAQTFNNMDLTLEFSTAAREVAAKWNIMTSCWLRHHCYERLVDCKVSPSLSMFITNITSAFWHGLYPGYYIAFTIASIAIENGRHWHKKIYPRIEFWISLFPFNLLYYIFNLMTTMITVGLAFYPFIVLSVQDTFKIYATLYYIPQILLIGSWIGLMII